MNLSLLLARCALVLLALSLSFASLEVNAAKPKPPHHNKNKSDLPARAKITSSSLRSKYKGLKTNPKAVKQLSKGTAKVGAKFKKNNKKKGPSAPSSTKAMRKKNQPAPGLNPRSAGPYLNHVNRDNMQRHHKAENALHAKAGTKKPSSNISERMRKKEGLSKGQLPQNGNGHLKKAFDKVRDGQGQ